MSYASVDVTGINRTENAARALGNWTVMWSCGRGQDPPNQKRSWSPQTLRNYLLSRIMGNLRDRAVKALKHMFTGKMSMM